MKMKLGILVTTDRHLEQVMGLTAAAVKKGHEVVIFAMDGGIALLDDRDFTNLGEQEGVSTSFCSHSARDQGVDAEAQPPALTVGSQLNNAMMANAVDRMINL
jgi:hypothetical protein